MNTTEVPQFQRNGFDNEKYKELQKKDILSRLECISNGHLYLEIGGKLFSDNHAARVLPGFDQGIKVKILKELNVPFDILFCLNSSDITSNRQLNNRSQDYIEASITIVKNLEDTFGIKPKIVITRINTKEDNIVESMRPAMQYITQSGYEIYLRYYIPNYPENVNQILSQEGYGSDDYISLSNKLVIVTGSASNSGKMSTCLGMTYQDHTRGLDSGYAKYETFPIWNLPLNHPINLAYEAATADIGDRNIIDTYHKIEYDIDSVNYNRDVEAFKIVKRLSENFLPEDNIIRKYKSPTDMGISNAGFAITNDELVCIASLKEIQRRKEWYSQVENHKQAWIKTCEELESDAKDYIKEKGYNPSLIL